MTRLVHLTDLHFGLHHPDLVEPLRAAVVASAPDVVVVSGDLTHRARAGQFGQAMAFLRGLEVPVMTVPGNHDVPLFNPLARLLMPFAAYRHGAAGDLRSVVTVGRLRLHGVNTADPWQWRGGVARRDEIDRVVRALRDSGPDDVNILVAHHPFQEPPGFQRGETKGASPALERLRQAGLHVILSGHLHHWTLGLGLSPDRPCPIFQMQAGTALCSRAQERDHGFAVLDFAGPALSVQPWIAEAATRRFAPRTRLSLVRHDGGWLLSD
ncbi:MAG: metallophosphoesterase family protein [Gemmobacter sp.]